MDIDIPEQFICPITLDIMRDPVICEDGHTYEREVIESLKKSISPITNQPINLKNLVPNRALKEIIDHYLLNLNQNNTQKNSREEKNIYMDDKELYRLGILKKDNMNDEEYLSDDEELYRLGILKRENKSKPNLNASSNKDIIQEQIVIKEIEEILPMINVNQKITDYFMDFVDKTCLALYYKPMLNEDINYVNWLYEEKTPVHKSLYLYAMINKLPQTIKWLIEKNISPDENIINFAVSIGNKYLVIWVLSLGIGWNIYTLSHSLVSSNEKFIKWLIDFGCFWGCLDDDHKNIIYSNEIIKKMLLNNNCSWII